MTASDVAVTRPLRRDAQRNRERILAAAHEVFATRGFAATLDDVAHHAGVGVGTVYRRFPTKEALIEAAFADRLGEVVAVAEQAADAPSAWDGLVEMLTRVTALHATDRGLRDAVLSLDKHHFAGVEQRLRTLVEGLAERAKAEGTLRPDFAATDLPMILNMISEVARTCGGERPDAYGRYLRLIIDGLRAGSACTPLGEPLTSDDVAAAMTACVPPTEGRRQ